MNDSIYMYVCEYECVYVAVTGVGERTEQND